MTHATKVTRVTFCAYDRRDASSFARAKKVASEKWRVFRLRGGSHARHEKILIFFVTRVRPASLRKFPAQRCKASLCSCDANGVAALDPRI